MRGGSRACTSHCAAEFNGLDEDEQDAAALRAIEALCTAGFDLALLLKVLLRRRPCIKGKRVPQKLIYARTAVVRSPDLFEILDGLTWHTHKLDASVDTWAVDHVKKIVVQDVECLAPHRCMQSDYSKEDMLAFSISETVLKMQKYALVLWDIAEKVAVSPRQVAVNTYKKSDPVRTLRPLTSLYAAHLTLWTLRLS